MCQVIRFRVAQDITMTGDPRDFKGVVNMFTKGVDDVTARAGVALCEVVHHCLTVSIDTE